MAAYETFMIPNSPKGKNNGKTSPKKNEILTLAPFNPSPRIIFQDVKVGHSVSQDLDIYNPGCTDVQVELSSKVPLADNNLEFTSTNFEVCASEKFVLKITWRPTQKGTFKIPIGVRTNTKFRSDFVILCVAAAPIKTEKKVLKPDNRNSASARPKPAAVAVPVPQNSKPATEPQERRKTFVLHGNKENVASMKKPSPPEPPPRKFSSASAEMRPTLLDNLVISPFVFAPSRFRDVELSPAVNVPWKQELSPPATGSIRRETYGVDERAALPTFRAKLENFQEEMPDAVDCTFRELNSLTFEPVTCSTTVKTPLQHDGSLGSVADGNDRLSGGTYVLDRLSTETFVKELDFNERRSPFNERRMPTRDEFRAPSSHTDHSDSLLEAISEEVDLKDSVTAFEISPPKPPTLKKAPRMSPKVITKRKIAVSPIIRIFSPDTPEDRDTGTERRKSLRALSPKVALPRLTLTRTSITGASRHSLGGSNLSRLTHSRQKATLASTSRQSQAASASRQSLAASSSRQSLAASSSCQSLAASASRQSLAASASRQSLAASASRQSLAASASRQSLAESASRQTLAESASRQTLAESASRQSFASATNSSRQSFAGATNSSRQSFASATNSSRQSFASATNSSRQSFASAVNSSRQSLSNLSIPNSSRTSVTKGRRQGKSEFLYDTDALINEMINNDLVAASSSADPFLTNTLFFDDSWKLKQEKDMIKWLNVLLTPPVELASEPENVDIALVWQHCCRTEQVDLAPTREDISSNMYDAQVRLNSLRKGAISYLAKTEIRQVLGKVSVHIDKKLLVVREDKDLHLDTGLKYQVVELLLSYNPLWLRIGLEAIYGRTINLSSNSDVVGLARFLVENLLYDKSIATAHSHLHVPHLRLPTFGDAMKKFILKKFFFLVYFLDRAKANKLIGHDPCLFLKNAKYKESKEILISFACQFLSGVGDILKHLALLGYHVTVKQQYLDEFEFAVTCLKDLRDGVRLVRVMEIILKNDTLLQKLRVPANSLLQKVHNMEVALKALSDSGYVILGNITAKDLVNGHYEKTLSLLWQIIYKFQAPRLEQAAKTIQSWWRDRELFREVKNRIAARKRAKCVAAAVRIQAAWRAHLARKRVALLRIERAAEQARRECAAIVLQKTWRMYAARKQLVRARRASNRIKEWYTGAVITQELRAKFLLKREAVIKIQSLLRGYLTRKRFAHLRRTAAALRIQTWFRRQRSARLLVTASTLCRKWAEERQRQSRACVIIQSRLRAHVKMRKQRSQYVELRNAARVIQRRFRLFLLMRRDRTAFLSLRHSVIVVQQAFRAKCAMKKQCSEYLAEKRNAVVIQRWFRAILEVRKVRTEFIVKKAAAVQIQAWFKAVRKRRDFLRIKRAVKIIEVRYSALLEARRQKCLFKTMRTSVITIQRWYRSVQQMRAVQLKFHKKWHSALVIQRAYRVYKLRQSRISSAVVIQRKWRATLKMRAERRAYTSLRSSAAYLQSWWRSVMLMKVEKALYQKLKAVTVVIQVRRRAALAGRKARQEYLELQMAAKVIQRRWRAKVAMERDRANYLRFRTAAVVTQRCWKSVLRRREKERLKKAVIFVQRVWRAKKKAMRLRNEFLAMKRAALFIQHKYRMKMYLKTGTAVRLRQEQAAIKIQAVWRGYTARKKRCQEITRINERCRLAAKAASEDKTLGFILSDAVNNFYQFQSNKTIEALVAINKVTVLSRELCISLGRSDFVTNLYNLLSACNRSELHRGFLTSGTSILVNLAKCQETIHHIWQDGSRVFFYLHLMNIWINKEQEIFLNCSTVLWHFSLWPEYCEEMIADPRMSRLLDIFARKTSKKQPFLSSNQDTNIIPSMMPSWGLILKDKKPSKFKDEKFAVEVLRSAVCLNHLDTIS